MFGKKQTIEDGKYLPDPEFNEALLAAQALATAFCLVSDKPNPVLLAGIASDFLPKTLSKKQNYLALAAASFLLAKHKRKIKNVHKKMTE